MGYTMCRTQCVLAVVALCIAMQSATTLGATGLPRLVRPWDYAVVTNKQVEYFAGTSKIYSDSFDTPLRRLTGITYDGVNDRMFLVNSSLEILSYDLRTKKFETVLRTEASPWGLIPHDFKSLSYDPVEQRLYWFDSIARNIKFVSLKPGARNEEDGNILVNMDVAIPKAIFVDSCNGYIYWSGLGYDRNPTIQRVRLDGGDSEVLVSDIGTPLEDSLVVDIYTKKLYWIEKEHNEIFYIKSADLDGRNKVTVFNGTISQPSFLALSEGYIYWMYNTYYRGVAQHLTTDYKHKLMSTYVDNDSRIVTNYKLNPSFCERLSGLSMLSGLLRSNAETDNVPLLACYNYCLNNGDCATNVAGLPKCSCKSGFSGERCEVDLCRGYCLNGGRCSINQNNKPVCLCNPSFSNEQCEIPSFLMKTFVAIGALKDAINLELPPVPSTCEDAESNRFLRTTESNIGPIPFI